MANKFYAVKNGRKPGIFTSWTECKSQISGYSGAVYKSFEKREDALCYLNGNTAVDTGEPCEATAYVDGSYNIHDKRFSCGGIIFANNTEHTFSECFTDPDLASMRNVAGEIKGAEYVMRYCVENGIKSVEIYHDYEGVARWCRGEWKTNKEGTRAYVRYYNSVKDRLDVRFTKVKGHSGDKYNDLADRLAKDALGIK